MTKFDHTEAPAAFEETELSIEDSLLIVCGAVLLGAALTLALTMIQGRFL